MPNTNLADLVSLTQDAEHLTLKIIKTTEPVKPFSLREVGKNPDGTAIFDVPKSDIFAYYARDLADGSVLTCMRRREIPYAKRLALFEAGIAAGFDVRPVDEPKAKGPKKAALTLESLTKSGMKPAASNGKKTTVTNSL